MCRFNVDIERRSAALCVLAVYLSRVRSNALLGRSPSRSGLRVFANASRSHNPPNRASIGPRPKVKKPPLYSVRRSTNELYSAQAMIEMPQTTASRPNTAWGNPKTTPSMNVNLVGLSVFRSVLPRSTHARMNDGIPIKMNKRTHKVIQTSLFVNETNHASTPRKKTTRTSWVAALRIRPIKCVAAGNQNHWSGLSRLP